MEVRREEAAGSQRLLAEMKIQYRAAEGLLDRYIEVLEQWQAGRENSRE